MSDLMVILFICLAFLLMLAGFAAMLYLEFKRRWEKIFVPGYKGPAFALMMLIMLSVTFFAFLFIMMFKISDDLTALHAVAICLIAVLIGLIAAIYFMIRDIKNMLKEGEKRRSKKYVLKNLKVVSDGFDKQIVYEAPLITFKTEPKKPKPSFILHAKGLKGEKIEKIMLDGVVSEKFGFYKVIDNAGVETPITSQINKSEAVSIKESYATARNKNKNSIFTKPAEYEVQSKVTYTEQFVLALSLTQLKEGLKSEKTTYDIKFYGRDKDLIVHMEKSYIEGFLERLEENWLSDEELAARERERNKNKPVDILQKARNDNYRNKFIS